MDELEQSKERTRMRNLLISVQVKLISFDPPITEGPILQFGRDLCVTAERVFNLMNSNSDTEEALKEFRKAEDNINNSIRLEEERRLISKSKNENKKQMRSQK